MSDEFDSPEGQREFLEKCLASLQCDVAEMQQLRVKLLRSGRLAPDDNPDLLRVIAAIRELKVTVDGLMRDLDERSEGQTP